jgi:hypothetical protein
MINDKPSKPQPKAIARQLLYTYIFDDDTEAAANRAIEQTLPKIRSHLRTEEIVLAISETLQDSSPLKDLLPNRHSEAEIRKYFEVIIGKIKTAPPDDRS